MDDNKEYNSFDLPLLRQSTEELASSDAVKRFAEHVDAVFGGVTQGYLVTVHGRPRVVMASCSWIERLLWINQAVQVIGEDRVFEMAQKKLLGEN